MAFFSPNIVNTENRFVGGDARAEAVGPLWGNSDGFMVDITNLMMVIDGINPGINNGINNGITG